MNVTYKFRSLSTSVLGSVKRTITEMPGVVEVRVKSTDQPCDGTLTIEFKDGDEASLIKVKDRLTSPAFKGFELQK